MKEWPYAHPIFQLAFLLFTLFSLTACGEAYFDEDTNQLVGGVESVGTDPYQIKRALVAFEL